MPTRRQVLAFAENSNVTLGEVVRQLRQLSLLGGGRPLVMSGPLAEVRPDDVSWRIFEVLTDNQFFELVWSPEAQRTRSERRIRSDMVGLQVEPSALIRTLVMEGRAPSEGLDIFSDLGAEIAWEGDRPPAWRTLDRPFSETETLLLSRDEDRQAPWRTPTPIDTLRTARQLSEATEGAPVDLADAAEVLCEGGACLANVIRRASSTDELKITCEAIVHGLHLARADHPDAPRLVREFLGRNESARVLDGRWEELKHYAPELESLRDALQESSVEPVRIEPSRSEAQGVRFALSQSNNGMRPYLTPGRVSLRNVVLAAARSSTDVQVVVEQLNRFGEKNGFDFGINADGLSGVPPRWLGEAAFRRSIETPQSVVNVAFTARSNGLTIDQALKVLDHFGMEADANTVRAYFSETARSSIPSEIEIEIMRHPAVSGHSGPVTLLSIAKCSHATKRGLHDVYRTVRGMLCDTEIELSYDAHDESSSGIVVTTAQLTALSSDLDGNDPFVGADVNLLHIWRLAARLGVTLSVAREIFEPFAPYGVSAAHIPPAWAKRQPTWEELCVLSDFIDARELDPGCPVTAAAPEIARRNKMTLARAQGLLEQLELLIS
jgi:hypothetical protein